MMLTILMIFLFMGCSRPEQGKVKIGAILPLTGGGSIYGEWIKKGCDLAVEHVNNRGGINGRQLSIIYEDDQASPKNAVTALQKMINMEKVNFIITGSSASTLALKTLAAQNNIILFAPAATHPDLTKESNNVFRNVISSYQETEVMSQYLIKDKGIDDIAVIYVNDAGGQGSLEAFKHNFEILGGKVIEAIPFEKRLQDYRNIVAKVKANNPTAIYLTGYGPEMAIILKQLRENQIATPIFSNQGIESSEIISQAGTAADGVKYTLASFDPNSNDKEIGTFVNAYKKKYREEPGLYQATSFDAVMMYALVRKRSNADFSSIIEGFFEIKAYNGASGVTTFTPSGDAIKPIAIKEIQAGRFVTLKTMTLNE